MGMYLGENPVAITKISNDTYGWLGSDVTYAGKLYEWNGTLDNTSYSTWTPSTTETEILAAQTSVANFTLPDRREESAYILTRWDVNVAYNSGATMTAAPVRYTCIDLRVSYSYPSSLTNYQSENYNLDNASNLGNTLYQLQYYNTSGSLTSSSSSYGPAYSNSGASWSYSNTGNQLTVTLNRPAIKARCSTTSFSTARASEVNTTNTTIRYRLDLFKGPADNPVKHKYGLIMNIWNDNDWDV